MEVSNLPKVLNKGWNLVRGINTVTTIGKLTPIGNAPSLAKVRKVAEDEALLVVTRQHGKHVNGHKNNDQAVENGEDKNK